MLLACQPGKRTIVRKSKCQLLGVAAGKGAEVLKTYHWIPDSPNRAPICCGQPDAAGFKPNNCSYLSRARSCEPWQLQPDSENNCSYLPDPLARNPNIFASRTDVPGGPNHRNPNILEASSTEPSCPEHKKTRTIHRLPRSLPPSARGNGVICPIMGLFVILCYLNHIICSWGDIFHSAFCHTLKLVKFLKHLLPIHRVHILVHNVAFINK